MIGASHFSTSDTIRSARRVIIPSSLLDALHDNTDILFFEAMMKPTRAVKPGGVREYIARHPREVQTRLHEMRSAIQNAAPRSIETVSYFEMPGYFYTGYDYNGMFAWFSFKKPHVRLHVRPPVIENHKKELAGYATTKAVVSFPVEKRIPVTLVKKLVKSSIKVMKEMKE
ncbi:MAG TPA: DUF1801 domain-containing protein [Bacteroidota bacterium]|nr:DUF1801 domain-containing protein [Bacteroidota bacterium]